LEKGEGEYNFVLWLVNTIICAVPFALLITGTTKRKPRKKQRMRIVNARILVQCITLMIYAIVTAVALIRGNRYDLIYWAAFHIITTGITPFLFGRVLCSWVCPNAAFQDGLLKYLNYKRPIPKLPKAIEEQSHSCAMNISGEVDKSAPLLPATLLLCWFPLFFCETVFDLVSEFWYPIGFMYGLFFLSMIFSWRKVCTHFCWLSSYRGLAGQGSLWRIRFNKSTCRDCKKCKPEEECPFFIDIRKQDNEMPASCSVCFRCMETCPYDDVLTYKRSKEEKARLKRIGQ
jgi:polyferredoxin